MKPVDVRERWQRFGWRHAVALLFFLVVCICYADRTNIGIVMAREDLPGIPHSKKGLVLSGFFVGYMISQIPGGVLCRRWGAKPVLMLAAITWTVFDALTPALASAGFTVLFLGRVGMGLGEGLVFPVQHALVAFWAPTHERATLLACMTSGQEFGSVLANLISPELMKLGQAFVFLTWAGVATIWMLFFALLGASAPEVHHSCTQSGEAAWIRETREAPHFEEVRHSHADEPPVPCRLLRAPSVWAILTAHCTVNLAWYIIVSWLPTFFADTYDLDLAARPHLLAAPYMAGWTGLMISARVSDFLISSRGVPTRHVRKFFQLLGALAGAFFLQCAAHAASAGVAAVWMMFALFFGRMQSMGFWVNMLDVCPETPATLMALSNSVGTVPGIIGQPLTQAIMSATGSWAIVFGVAGVVQICGALIFTLLGDDRSLDQDQDMPKRSRSDGAVLSHVIGRQTI